LERLETPPVPTVDNGLGVESVRVVAAADARRGQEGPVADPEELRVLATGAGTLSNGS